MLLLLIRQIILGLSLAAPIGPINIEIIRRGIQQGFWPSLLVGAGGMTTDLTFMYLMYQGLAEYVNLPWVQFSLLIMGAVILSIMGVQSLLTHPDHSAENLSEARTSISPQLLKSYLTGISIAAFNPINILFWVGIYGSILSDSFHDADLTRAFLLNSAIFIGIGLWNLNLALTVHFGRTLMNPAALRLITSAASLFLLGLGLYFGCKAVLKISSLL
ncbi:LysE family translocator [Halobacillus sp. A5]|uniref:LysE family translocator n=1 Tax=Halobacillus sp. A5 TaxID=2880263 RepID=UPI0020A61FB8|nr:LysE family transporter [Halobacillus sp. A5]MCP3028498.1 LysE family translocator [Halobacillus sp. A5]